MSYNIETRSITEFVTDSKIKLPRFQRKSTWTAKQNFELAISIFQEYPVGVVIINDEGHTSWLLDGRQRRSALKDLRANPDLVYDWARKYIKFKSNQDIVEVKQMFWEKIDAYLQQEENDDEDPVEDDSSVVSEPNLFEEEKDEDLTGPIDELDELNTEEKTIVDLIQDIQNHGKKKDLFEDLMATEDETTVLGADSVEENNNSLKDVLVDITQDLEAIKMPETDFTHEINLEKEVIKNNPCLLTKKIIINQSYEISDYEEVTKLYNEFSDIKDNIYIIVHPGTIRKPDSGFSEHPILFRFCLRPPSAVL